jgi:hypothetical protein
MQVGCEYISILIDGPVLDNSLPGFPDHQNLAKPAVKKIDLQIERPSLHVFIKAVEIGVRFNILKMRLPIKMLGKQLRQGSLP